ncbi:DUF5712 family protein [Sphingobacterium sp. HJSM2_6]|uniref:DUF5712 family protein n=1 Tax=Sphingobacterium sp. HJSM2_6 TaxID=3366264 RepID=UPI003BBF2C6E
MNYLEKENRLVENLSESEKWFNRNSDAILPHEVRMAIDANVAKLSRADGKFYLINISPSQKEITFLLERFGEQEAKLQLKKFAIKVMDAYAKNFHREGMVVKLICCGLPNGRRTAIPTRAYPEHSVKQNQVLIPTL